MRTRLKRDSNFSSSKTKDPVSLKLLTFNLSLFFSILMHKLSPTGLRIRIFNFCLKLLTCVLYIIRVMTDNPAQIRHTWSELCFNVCECEMA